MELVKQHNFRAYKWLDFAASLGGVVFLAYVILAYFVPTDQLLMNKLARRSLKI